MKTATDYRATVLDILKLNQDTYFDFETIHDWIITDIDSDASLADVTKCCTELIAKKAVDYYPKEKVFGYKSDGEEVSMLQELSQLRTRLNVLEKLAAESNGKSGGTLTIQLMKGNKVVKKSSDTYHKEFRDIVDLADMRENIFIWGPTGCGKTHMLGQLADALKMRWGMTSCNAGIPLSELNGNLLPTGPGGAFEYTISMFLDLFENGGVFLFDEIDAADPNVLLYINSALANGYAPVVKRKKKPIAERHPDFVCIAAGNTSGTNANRLYTSRHKLDAATLDRFCFKVEMDYDQLIERSICPDDEIIDWCWKVRQAIKDHNLERTMSTRFIKSAFKMKVEKAWDLKKIAKRYMSGWREEEVNKMRSYVTVD